MASKFLGHAEAECRSLALQLTRCAGGWPLSIFLLFCLHSPFYLYTIIFTKQYWLIGLPLR